MIETAMTEALSGLWRACRVPCAIVLLALSMTACSDDVTTTNPSDAPNLAGVWTGTYRIRTCTDAVTTTPGQLCGTLAGTTAPLRLSLQQDENRVVGNLEFSGWSTRSLIVTGLVQPDGGLALTGSANFVDPLCPTVQIPVSLVTWTSLLNRARDGMTGDFRVTASARASACVLGTLTIEADTLQLTRQ